MWSSLFSVINTIAMIGWVMLAFLPRAPLIKTVIMYLGVGLLCLIYAVLLGLIVSGSVDPGLVGAAGGAQPGFSSIAAVRAIFASDGGAVIGWTHYLAFDLFTGLWIANDADNKGFARWLQVPFLFVTLMVGPVGLLVWLLVRERRARATARAAGMRG